MKRASTTDNRMSFYLRFNDHQQSLNEAAQAKCSYQPQRTQAKYGWLPWAAFVLAMVGLALFNIYFTRIKP